MRDRTLRVAARLIRRGPRKVIWTQPNANLGNFLYDWMHAWTWRGRGLDIVCLRTPAADRWVPLFGSGAEALVVDRDAVRPWDRREKGLYNEFGTAFSSTELEAFISGFLEPSGLIDAARVPPTRRLEDHDVLVNVRRGDYFATDANRRAYAFDLDEYLVAALETLERGGGIGRIQVVSDGIDWCVDHVGWLSDHCRELDFVREPMPPETHLAMLANAPRLVLANSTFSYWGGYLSGFRSGHPERVVAPWFHCRLHDDGRAWQLDPRWSVVTDIPSHWQLPHEDR